MSVRFLSHSYGFVKKMPAASLILASSWFLRGVGGTLRYEGLYILNPQQTWDGLTDFSDRRETRLRFYTSALS